MDDIIEYVREWNLESSKNGLERYMKEHDEELREETRVEAIEERNFDIAKNMLNLEISVDKIMKATGLTRKEILSLK